MNERYTQYPFRAPELVLNCVEGPVAGPPMLFLHGLCDRWQWLRPILDHMSGRTHVHSFDMRGHGESSRAQGAYLPMDYALDAKAFIHGRLSEPAIVFGHSAGGLVALWCAATCPEKVRAVINGDLFGSTQRLADLIKRPESISYYGALQSLAGRSRDEIAESSLGARMPRETLDCWSISTSLLDPEVLRHYASGDGDAYVQGFNTDKILAGVACPVLLVSGEPSCGGVMAEEDIAYACDRIADAQHVQLRGLGHGLGLSTAKPEQLLEAIDGFMASLS